MHHGGWGLGTRLQYAGTCASKQPSDDGEATEHRLGWISTVAAYWILLHLIFFNFLEQKCSTVVFEQKPQLQRKPYYWFQLSLNISLITSGDNCLNFKTYQPQTCLIHLWKSMTLYSFRSWNQQYLVKQTVIQLVVNPYTVNWVLATSFKGNWKFKGRRNSDYTDTQAILETRKLTLIETRMHWSVKRDFSQGKLANTSTIGRISA